MHAALTGALQPCAIWRTSSPNRQEPLSGRPTELISYLRCKKSPCPAGHGKNALGIMTAVARRPHLQESALAAAGRGQGCLACGSLLWQAMACCVQRECRLLVHLNQEALVLLQQQLRGFLPVFSY